MYNADPERILASIQREKLLAFCALHNFGIPNNGSSTEIAAFLASKDPELANQAAQFFTILEAELLEARLQTQLQMAADQKLAEARQLVAAMDQKVQAADKTTQFYDRMQKLIVVAAVVISVIGGVATWFGVSSFKELNEQTGKFHSLETNATARLVELRAKTEEVTRQQKPIETGLRTFEILHLVDSCRSIIEGISSSVNSDQKQTIQTNIAADLSRLKLVEETFTNSPATNDFDRADGFMIGRLKAFYKATLVTVETLSATGITNLTPFANARHQWEESRAPRVQLQDHYWPAVRRLNACSCQMIGNLYRAEYSSTPDSDPDKEALLDHAQTHFCEAIEDDPTFAKPHNSRGALAVIKMEYMIAHKPVSLPEFNNLFELGNKSFQTAQKFPCDPYTLALIYNNWANLHYDWVRVFKAPDLKTQPKLLEDHLKRAHWFAEKAKELPNPSGTVILTGIEIECLDADINLKNTGDTVKEVSDELRKWHSDYNQILPYDYFVKESPIGTLIQWQPDFTNVLLEISVPSLPKTNHL
jgi:negative regulator of sigma E activity